jgi:hypothetical protein
MEGRTQMQVLTDWIPRLLMILCLLAFIPWALGVPGVQNRFAIGWTTGLYAIVLYVLAFAVLSILRLVSGMGWVPIDGRTLDGVTWVAVIAFAIAQAIAWYFILTN